MVAPKNIAVAVVFDDKRDALRSLKVLNRDVVDRVQIDMVGIIDRGGLVIGGISSCAVQIGVPQLEGSY